MDYNLLSASTRAAIIVCANSKENIKDSIDVGDQAYRNVPE
jgi:hypothetical protein